MDGISELIAYLLTDRTHRGVLVLGFDGTARLLGHPDHLGLTETLAGDSYANIAGPVAGLTNRNALVSDALDFARSITAPVGNIDLRAIEVVAGLLNSGRLSCVIAGDPGLRLFSTLQNGVDDLEQISLETHSRESIRSAFRRGGRSRPLFVDIGAALLTDYWNSLKKSQSEDLRRLKTRITDMETELKEYLKDYRDVYCWGWCSKNAPLHWMVPDTHDLTVHRIGRHTVFDDFQANPLFEYEEAEGGEEVRVMANGGWFERVADAFNQASMPLLGSVAATHGRGAGALWRPRSSPVQPMLARAELDDLARHQEQREIRIVGVESEQVRRSAAEWLDRELAVGGGMTVRKEGGHLRELLIALTAQLAGPVEQHVIGCYTGELPAEGDDSWRTLLENAAELWVEECRRRSSCRLTLFCPTWMSQWASEQWRGEGVFAQSHFRRYQNVKLWLGDSLDQNDLSADSASLDRFARDIAEPAASGHAVPPGFEEEALETLVLDIVQSAHPRSERREVSATELDDTWNNVVDRYLEAATGIGRIGHDDEDFVIVPKLRETDFAMKIRPRPPVQPPENQEDGDE
ncbi:hypothetical protein ACFVUH_30200 [Kitasatospora sp. NPDC058032]|uniref:hypothetical protein n=1 Tax=Kitasatospora sp. NPDC058032 TaxID=3346307 RepID=UPI0036DE9813